MKFGWRFLGVGILASNLELYSEDFVEISIDSKLKKLESQGKSIYVGDRLSLSSHEKLVVNEKAAIFVDEVDLAPSSVIDSNGHPLEVFAEKEFSSDGGLIDVSFDAIQDTSGADGALGEDGLKAVDALKGAAGLHGGDATDGGHAGDAAPITILSPIIRGNILLKAKGGDGGKGGMGGSGGKGGDGLSGIDARTLYYFKKLDDQSPQALVQLAAMMNIPYAGQALLILWLFNGLKIGNGFDGFDGGAGGFGGRGGSGGDGGNGGDIQLTFGQQVQGTKIYINSKGGKGGSAGRGGIGGNGGQGGLGGKRGDIWARDGKPGNAGLPGEAGAGGRPGKPGKAGKVKVVETQDPQWLMCYIRYRKIRDSGEDLELAKEVLRSCS